MKIVNVRVSVNLKKIVNLMIECGYKPTLEITDGENTIRFDSVRKKNVRFFYITDHTGSGYVKELRKYLYKKNVKSDFVLDPKNVSVLKMLTINIIDDYNEQDRRYLVAKNVSAYNSYYSVILIPKTKMIFFYKPQFFRSRELRQSYKEILMMFEIRATRKIFGFKL